MLGVHLGFVLCCAIFPLWVCCAMFLAGVVGYLVFTLHFSCCRWMVLWSVLGAGEVGVDLLLQLGCCVLRLWTLVV